MYPKTRQKTGLRSAWRQPIAISVGLLCWGLANIGQAQDSLDLDTTTITGNTELPKSLYVVPWQDREIERDDEYRLSLHNLYGDLFDPRLPNYLDAAEYQSALPPEPAR